MSTRHERRGREFRITRLRGQSRHHRVKPFARAFVVTEIPVERGRDPHLGKAQIRERPAELLVFKHPDLLHVVLPEHHGPDLFAIRGNPEKRTRLVAWRHRRGPLPFGGNRSVHGGYPDHRQPERATNLPSQEGESCFILTCLGRWIPDGSIQPR